MPRELDSFEQLNSSCRRYVPTPTAGDSKGSGGRTSPSNKAHSGMSLTDYVRGDSGIKRSESTFTGGPLNPSWVEWLMGWPIGWTDIEPLDRAEVDRWARLGSAWWAEEPEGLPRTLRGVSARRERLMALGNGQVSLCAATAWEGLT